MNFTRVRTRTVQGPYKYSIGGSVVTTETPFSGLGLPVRVTRVETETTGTMIAPSKNDTIKDFVVRNPNRRHNHIPPYISDIKWSTRGVRKVRPVQACSHTKDEILPVGEGTFAFGHEKSGLGSYPYQFKLTQWTDTCRPINYYKHLTGAEIAAALAATPTSAGLTAPPSSDWFSLLSRFNEACDSFVPSSFLVGEDMVENAIFIDAFKILLNPTRAVKYLFEGVRKLGLEKKTLGKIAHVSKSSANAYLSYNFGVKPAIEDIKSVFLAHRKVNERLEYLRSHSGLWTPIRVRAKTTSSLPVATFPTTRSFTTQWDEYSNVQCISAMGLVREDLNFGDTWTAYMQYFGLNKAIGLLWELVPFSFVIDWFSNAQERINEFTRLHLGPAPFYQISGLSTSTKITSKLGMYITPGDDAAYNGAKLITPSSPMCIAQRVRTQYDRSLKIPNTSGTLDIGGLGLFHGITGGALLLQKII